MSSYYWSYIKLIEVFKEDRQGIELVNEFFNNSLRYVIETFKRRKNKEDTLFNKVRDSVRKLNDYIQRRNRLAYNHHKETIPLLREPTTSDISDLIISIYNSRRK